MLSKGLSGSMSENAFRILCLHGAHQDQEVFRYKTERVKSYLESTCNASTSARAVSLYYLDAPLKIALLNPDDTVHMRCWYSMKSEGVNQAEDGEDQEAPIELLKDTLSLQEKAVDDTGWAVSRMGIQEYIEGSMDGRCDAILGFSQGCVAAMRFVLEEPKALVTYGVKGLLLCGSPGLPNNQSTSTFPASLRSLHVIGDTDALVPASESLQLAESHFTDPQLLRHSAGHLVPHNQKQLQVMQSFVQSLIPPEDTQETQDLVSMEVEGLQSIFETLTCQFDPRTSQHTISVDIGNADGIDGSVLVEVTLPPRYPEEGHGPRVQEVRGSYMKRVSQGYSAGYLRWWAHLQVEMDETLSSLEGSSSLFTLLQCIKDAADRLNDSIQSGELKSNQHIAGLHAQQDADEAQQRDPWDEADEDPAQREQLARGAQRWADKKLAEVRAKVAAASTKLTSSESSAADGSAAASLHTQREILYGGKKSRGQWKYCVGLVGKPSAGKSTFFNAVTDPDSQLDAAKVGAFPFTTIEPNVGRAFVGVPCPSSQLMSEEAQREQCGPQYGYIPGPDRLRRVPITVKDVAGLVPGAYQGHGKGNRFLNDLCDADILVHVVDGSGKSTAGGVSLEGSTDGQATTAGGSSGPGATEDDGTASDPVKDIYWIRDEIHHWVYDNVRSKWRTILTRPSKLLGMFTGYHSNPSFVEELLESVLGVKMSQLGARLTLWGPEDLHRLVAVFIAARFPIVMALNKSDAPTASAHWTKVKECFPEAVQEGMLCRMSARVESELLKLRREGVIEYHLGEVPSLHSAGKSDASGEDGTQRRELAARLIEFVKKSRTDSTGVQEVLGAALARKPALYLYPVKDFTSYHSAIEDGSNEGGSSSSAKDKAFTHCLLMHQGSTVEDCYQLLKEDVKCVSGKFVRCEGIVLPATTSSTGENAQPIIQPPGPTILRKEDTLNSGIALLRIMTNKRS